MPATPPSPPETAAAGGDSLLADLGPELYRFNAFRLTGLRVDTPPRRVQRRLQELKIRGELANGAPPPASGPLPLEPAPDLDDLRSAAQRLRDPRRRLLDELFWFWPGAGTGGSDPGLAALESGDHEAASAAWSEAAGRGHVVAAHNLAVLHHVLALDLEAGPRRLPAGDHDRRDRLWRQAIERWRELVADDHFWRLVGLRVRDLDDPRLETDLPLRLREALPAALVGIDAALAAIAADAGDRDAAGRHARRVREWGFAAATVDAALDRAARPLTRRLERLCETAGKEAGADPAAADQAGRRLLEQAAEPLGALDVLLPEDDSRLVAAHDRVALEILTCQIQHGRETDDWDASAELLRLALGTVRGGAARARLEDNLRIVESNREHQRLSEVCFFCAERSPEPAAAHEVKLHGEVLRVPVPGGTQVRWRTATVGVPRCDTCRRAHRRQGLRAAWRSAGVWLGLGGCGVATAATEEPFAGLLAWIGLAVAGMVIGALAGGPPPPPGVRELATADSFPRISELIGAGWAHGERPPGVAPS